MPVEGFAVDISAAAGQVVEFKGQKLKPPVLLTEGDD